MTKKFEADCYVSNEEQFQKYREFKLGGIIDFNHAALQRPFKEVYEAVNNPQQAVSYTDGRRIAAQLVNLKDSSRVILGRNTTEAMSFTYWLTNVGNGKLICTDAENESIARIYQEHRDHGNTKGKDRWSTFPDAIVAEDFEGLEGIIKTPTKVIKVPVLADRGYNKVIDSIDKDTRLVVISHVIRNNGHVVYIEDFARKAKQKNPNVYVAVDGAQALGNLPSIDFEKLEEAGVDFYAATPHKTLGSYPIGILYVSKRAMRNAPNLQGLNPKEQIIMEGMIDDAYGIKPNIETKLNQKRILSLAKAVGVLRQRGYLTGNDFSRKSEYARALKQYFLERLREYDVSILEREGRACSTAILGFRFNGKDNGDIVRRLQEKGVLTSYISETDNIRVSFDVQNSKQDVDKYFEILPKTIQI